MQITVKLHATLSDYLPAQHSQYSVNVEVAAKTTPLQILDHFEVPHDKIHLLLINGVYVDPQDRDKALLSDGDTLAVWPPIAGG